MGELLLLLMLLSTFDGCVAMEEDLLGIDQGLYALQQEVEEYKDKLDLSKHYSLTEVQIDEYDFFRYNYYTKVSHLKAYGDMDSIEIEELLSLYKIHLELLHQNDKDVSDFNLAKKSFYDWYQLGHRLLYSVDKTIVFDLWLKARRAGQEAMDYLYVAKKDELLLQQEDIESFIKKRFPHICNESD